MKSDGTKKPSGVEVGRFTRDDGPPRAFMHVFEQNIRGGCGFHVNRRGKGEGKPRDGAGKKSCYRSWRERQARKRDGETGDSKLRQDMRAQR